MSKYTDLSAAGYLLEVDACGKVLKSSGAARKNTSVRLNRNRKPEKKEFETVMGYRSEEDIRDAYGWEFITEAQFDRYIEIFRKGEQALEEHSPTVNELTYRILCRMISDIDLEQREWRFSALSPAEQAAEVERARNAKQEWARKIQQIREELGMVNEENAS